MRKALAGVGGFVVLDITDMRLCGDVRQLPEGHGLAVQNEMLKRWEGFEGCLLVRSVRLDLWEGVVCLARFSSTVVQPKDRQGAKAEIGRILEVFDAPKRQDYGEYGRSGLLGLRR